MQLTHISDIIPQKNIIILSPHYDDVLFMLGGYILALKKADRLRTKSVYIKLIFSKSNYQAREGKANFETTKKRIQYATGVRLIEDLACNDDLLGAFGYSYELLGEKECFVRGKSLANSEMEFPHGMYPDFNEKDKEIFARMKQRIATYAQQEDTAIIFPMAIKEHIDHFIVREAGIEVAKDLGAKGKASFYFQEDKPYGGLATKAELQRMETFIQTNNLQSIYYAYDHEKVVALAFEHYPSQVEEVYRKGVVERAKFLQKKLKASTGVDRICNYAR